jgi:hypothetical protein
MTATAAQIADVRRMTNEPTTAIYSDGKIQAAIERYPLVDARGEAPWVESTITPGTLEVNDDWTPTYDLNWASASIWAEKAAVLAGDYDFQADGGNYSRSQAYVQAMQQSRYFLSRRSIKTITQRPEPMMSSTEELEE